jgi:asparagine synthase (glutamine-hydrolysing)
VTRWLAGSFDPRDRTDSSRLAAALTPHQSTLFAHGPLRAAYSGPARGSHSPLCLLDGFLDNASELSAALEVPPGASPEELLARGWRRWGRGLPARLRGDFALLVWDREHGEGVLARDQLGVRSLFLHDSSGTLYFASELRHLLALLPLRPAPDPVGVAYWVTMSGRPGPATLYEGIRRLNPGAMLLLDRHGVREEHYWTPQFVEPLDLPQPQLAERLREAIGCAVARRLSPKGLTGVLMSGGLDSSSVAAVAVARASPGAVAAYSAEFPDHPAVDESRLIDQLRSELELGGVTAEVRSGGLLRSALEWIETWGMPLTSWGEFWAGPLLRAASRAGVEVVLGGDGGDELFDCRAYLMADRLRAGRLRDVLALARELPGMGDQPPRRALLLAAQEFALRGAIPGGLHQILDRPQARRRLPRWLRPWPARALTESDDPFAWKRLDGPRWWAYDAHVLTRGVEELGVFENHRRRAALAGLENRHPLFDLNLLELGLRQPPLATFDRSQDRPLLRTSMSGLLPDSVRLRTEKALFDSLLVDALTGPDGAAVRTLLSNPRAELAAYVNLEDVRRTLLDGGPGATHNPFRWMYQVWRLVTAECWLRTQAPAGAEALAAELRASTPRVALRMISR